MWVERTMRGWVPTVSVPTSRSAGRPWKRTTAAREILKLRSRLCAAPTSASLAARSVLAFVGSGSVRG